MDPVSLGLVSVGASAAGAGVGALGNIFGGLAGSASSKYKAAIAGINAKIAQQNAQWAIQSGDITAEEQGLRAGQEIAETNVRDAASGLDVAGTSAQRLRSTQTAVAGFDQQVTRFNAAKAAWSDRAQAAADTAQQKLDLQTAQYDVLAGGIGAVGSILGGATSVSSKWLQPGGPFSGGQSIA